MFLVQSYSENEVHTTLIFPLLSCSLRAQPGSIHMESTAAAASDKVFLLMILISTNYLN